MTRFCMNTEFDSDKRKQGGKYRWGTEGKEGAAPFNRAALEASVDPGGDPPSMINIFQNC